MTEFAAVVTTSDFASFLNEFRLLQAGRLNYDAFLSINRVVEVGSATTNLEVALQLGRPVMRFGGAFARQPKTACPNDSSVRHGTQWIVSTDQAC